MIINGKRIKLTNVLIIVLSALAIVYFIKRIGSNDESPQLESIGRFEDVTPVKERLSPQLEQDPLVEIPSEDKGKSIFEGLTGKTTCADYTEYSTKRHKPLSEGPLRLPMMRPPDKCRTFVSPAVERIIEELRLRVDNPDLMRLIENCLPNTLDTTVLWHKKASTTKKTGRKLLSSLSQSFIVTGDIHAEWLRDAARQLSVYQPLAKYDDDLKEMLAGAINTQAYYITVSPYCNAFHPPPESHVKHGPSSVDAVTPRPNWKQVFECKWELDSLASFLTLSNEYYKYTGDTSFINDLWLRAFHFVLSVLKRQTSPTFDEDGNVLPFYYTFQRDTRIGSETLPLAGTGNPVRFGTGLVRSAFRPSDDATIFQFFIPANAHMYVELERISALLIQTGQDPSLIERAQAFARDIRSGIEQFGIVDHPTYGKVYAYEVDGYGGSVFMDDANVPSLLSLPDLGFLEKDDPIYINTRKMILTNKGNPYFLKGKYFEGIGGPHVGIQNAWPMSLLMEIRTTDDDRVISKHLGTILETTAGLGLMHETVNVNVPSGLSFTRSWFAWCNSELGKTIMDLAVRKPHLIFKKGSDQPMRLAEIAW